MPRFGFSTRSARFSVVLSVFGLAACDPDGAVNPLTGARAPQPVPQFQRTTRLQTLDDRFAAMAESVPGFGGAFYDVDGRLTIWAKNPTGFDVHSRQRIAEMLRDQRGGRRLPGDGDPRVLPGRYDFRELLAAYRSLVLPAIPTIDGVTTSDIDEVHHRIVIGVGDESLIGRARQKIANLGLSNDLVEIEHVPPPELDADLNDFVRPVLGALKVSVMGDCTLGFNLIRYVGSAGDTAATARYFVTNSHCTTNRNSVDGNTAFQGGSFIATEIGDPAAFNHSGNPLCPSGYICRWADVALFEYDDPSDADQGQVAFPTLNTTTFSNSVTITAVQGPMAGYGINMIGRVSGRRSATVLATCVDVWGITDWPSGRLLCQGRSNYVRASGDSGAPVITAFGDGTAWATGVHWGGNSTNSYFSSMDIVLNELFYGVPGWPNLSPVVYP